MSQLTTIQNNLPANVEEEADNLLATTQGHEKLLKFVKGKYKVMDDEVSLGTEFIVHADQLVFCWPSSRPRQAPARTEPIAGRADCADLLPSNQERREPRPARRRCLP